MSNSIKTINGGYYQQTPICDLIKMSNLGLTSFTENKLGLTFEFQRLACEETSKKLIKVRLSLAYTDLGHTEAEFLSLPFEQQEAYLKVECTKFWTAYKLTVVNEVGDTIEKLTDFTFWQYFYPEHNIKAYDWPKSKPRASSKFTQQIKPDFGFMSDYLKLIVS